jgi:hypothetical protein
VLEVIAAAACDGVFIGCGITETASLPAFSAALTQPSVWATVTAGPDAAVTGMSGIARVANALAGGTVSGPSATVRALLYLHNLATASVVALNAPNG